MQPSVRLVLSPRKKISISIFIRVGTYLQLYVNYNFNYISPALAFSSSELTVVKLVKPTTTSLVRRINPKTCPSRSWISAPQNTGANILVNIVQVYCWYGSSRTRSSPRGQQLYNIHTSKKKNKTHIILYYYSYVIQRDLRTYKRAAAVHMNRWTFFSFVLSRGYLSIISVPKLILFSDRFRFHGLATRRHILLGLRSDDDYYYNNN